jgi:hypothetical protein
MHTDIKLKISALVAQWELNNYAEFTRFVEARRAKTETLAKKFAEMPTTGFIERLLYEIPESLDIYITQNIEDEEMAWLKSKIGGLWFAKTFMQYNVSQHT